MLILQKQWNGRAGIYQIRSKSSNKRYIGQSRNLYLRIRDHIAELKRGGNKSSALQELYDFYGADDMEVSVLMYVDKNRLDYSEQFVIDLFLKYGIPLVNIASNGVVTSVQGITRLPTMISFAAKKSLEVRKYDPTIKEKMRIAGKKSMQMLRQNPEVEAKRKLKAALSQRRKDVQERRSATLKMLSAKGVIPRFKKGGIPHNRYKVIHIPTGKEFDSVTLAASWANVSLATMSRWVNGRKEKGKQARPKHSDWQRKDV